MEPTKGTLVRMMPCHRRLSFVVGEGRRGRRKEKREGKNVLWDVASESPANLGMVQPTRDDDCNCRALGSRLICECNKRRKHVTQRLGSSPQPLQSTCEQQYIGTPAHRYGGKYCMAAWHIIMNVTILIDPHNSSLYRMSHQPSSFG